MCSNDALLGAALESVSMNSIAILVARVLLALLFTWGGLVIAYYLPYPLGFFITTLAFGTYLVVRLVKDGPGRAKRGFLTVRNISKGGAL